MQGEFETSSGERKTNESLSVSVPQEKVKQQQQQQNWIEFVVVVCFIVKSSCRQWSREDKEKFLLLSPVAVSQQSAGKRTEISNIALSFFYFQDGLREERWENE